MQASSLSSFKNLEVVDEKEAKVLSCATVCIVCTTKKLLVCVCVCVCVDEVRERVRGEARERREREKGGRGGGSV